MPPPPDPAILAPSIPHPRVAQGPVALALVRLGLVAIFPLVVVAALAATTAVTVPGIPRYDLLLLLCLLAQWALLRSGLESRRELLTVCGFHLVGLAMEVFKVHVGSWSYPEAGICRLAGVPLYSGFMYASVASFLCGCYRHFAIRTVDWPRAWPALGLAAAIYANFFSHHYLVDLRWGLFVATAVLFARSRVTWRHTGPRRSLPVPLVLLGLGVLLYLAENLATGLGAWSYPDQLAGWRPVAIGKLGSWSLLIVLTLILVRACQPRERR